LTQPKWSGQPVLVRVEVPASPAASAAAFTRENVHQVDRDDRDVEENEDQPGCYHASRG